MPKPAPGNEFVARRAYSEAAKADYEVINALCRLLAREYNREPDAVDWKAEYYRFRQEVCDTLLYQPKDQLGKWIAKMARDKDTGP